MNTTMLCDVTTKVDTKFRPFKVRNGTKPETREIQVQRLSCLCLANSDRIVRDLRSKLHC